MHKNKIKKKIEYKVNPYTNVSKRNEIFIDRIYFTLKSPIELRIMNGILKIGFTDYKHFKKIFKILFDFSDFNKLLLGEIISNRGKKIYSFFKKNDILKVNEEPIADENLKQYIFFIKDHYSLDFAIKNFRKFDNLRIFSASNKNVSKIIKNLENSFLFLNDLPCDIFDLCDFILFFEEFGDNLIIEGKNIPNDLYSI